MDIEEANEEMDLNLPKGEYETLAGFVLAQLGEIPKEGDQFRYNNLLFRIQEMDRFKIDSVLIRKNNTSNKDDTSTNNLPRSEKNSDIHKANTNQADSS